MTTFITWLPAILHVIGIILSALGVNNFANAGTNPAIPMWAQIPLFVIGLLFHAGGVTVSKTQHAVASAALPVAPKGADPVLHGLHAVHGLLIEDTNAAPEEFDELAAMIKRRKTHK